MAEHDPLDDLRDVLRGGETSATPLPIQRVRQLGHRRRVRRRIATSALALALLAGGGAAVSSAIADREHRPDPATIQTAVPSPPPFSAPAPPPTRTVTGTNLLRPSDLAVSGDVSVREYQRSARPVDEVSVCQRQTWQELGALAQVSRSYQQTADPAASTTPDPEDPLATIPTAYAVAAQFSEPAAATRARQTYHDWVASCPEALSRDGYTIVGGTVTWHQVQVAAGQAEFAEVTYRQPGASQEDDAYFESIGLTQVEDRLMVTVSLHHGQDFNVAYDQQGDPDLGLSAHPQFAMCVAAAQRLGR